MLEVRSEVHGEVVVVVVVGEFDLAAVPAVRPSIIEALAARPGGVVMDLRAVDFIDSAGIGVVVGAVRRARLAGGECRIVVEDDRVRAVFAIIGLDRVLEFADTIDDAVAAFGQAVPHG